MFSGSTQAVRRFSLLLLDEGELYLDDFVAVARWPAAVAGNWQRLPRLAGQLRLCTKSLFFESDDARVPIVRLPFQHVEGMEGRGGRHLLVTASRLVKMRGNAADAPYVVERCGPGCAHPAPLAWEFELSFARLEAVVPLAQQMVVASRLPAGEAEEFVKATMAAAEEGARFDLGALRSPAERLVAELAATLLSEGALVRQPGRLLLTDARIYFQPTHAIGGDAAARSHPLAAVAAVARRRSSLRDVALEVFFGHPLPDHSARDAAAPFWGGPSALLAFRSREEREQAAAALAGHPALGVALSGGGEAAAACSAILEADPAWLSRVTGAWQRGLLSNLDYLLFLNLASGRSFADLSQYPVMPWVLADYTSPSLDLADPARYRDLSRPVGALNPRRLAMLRARHADMAGLPTEPPFMYGSHYSAPGFTMFWLVRAAPAHMLRLQAGRFDAPDRLFCSVAEAWEGVTGTNPADVKELIPEFYLRHDFLLNSRGLALGTRQSGRPVGDVELPPWAASAPHFLSVMRAALEAPFVSANLHSWIDLVFGHLQRGEAALQADNLFRHTAYEGAVDLEAVADPVERAALEMQIQEFGQCPRQLFKQKHPQRLVCPPAEFPTPEAAAAAASSAGDSSQALPLALVSATLAAASSLDAEHGGRVEVPPQLAELDVQAARQRRQEAEAASRAAVSDGEGSPLAAGGSGGVPEPGEGAGCQDQLPSASPGSSRLRSLGAWATERKQAVGERLAGSVGAVRGALAGATPAGGAASAAAAGGSASRLQSLFSRKSPASPSGVAAAGAPADALPGSAGDEAVLGPQPSERAAPSPPGVRGAAALVGSIGSKLSSLALARGKEPGASPSLPSSPQLAAAPPPAEAAAAALQQPGAQGSPLWKFSRREGQQGAAAAAAQLAGDTSDEEEAGLEPGQAVTAGLVTGAGSAAEGGWRGGAAAADLLERQRQRMMRHGRELDGGAASDGGAGSRPSGWYGPGLYDRLAPARVLPAASESINGCALACVGGLQHAYSASHSGWLCVHQLVSGRQVRAAAVSEQPLTSVALLAAAGGGGGGGGTRHPLALCGSFDACVHAYSPDYGRTLGSFQAASDAVACVQVVGGGAAPPRLVSASWDGSVRGWELAEGRQPWSAAAGLPTWSLQAPSGVWAVAAAPSGGLVLAGTEDGLVVCWDTRQAAAPRPLWRLQLLPDNYVSGLEVCPGGTAAVAAAADGALSLLDLRRGGAVAASMAPSGAPLRSCATDGGTALAGDERGELHLWSVAQQLDGGGALPSGAWTPPQPDGLFPPLAPGPASPVNALAAAPCVCSGGGGIDVVTGHEDGQLRWLSTAAGAVDASA